MENTIEQFITKHNLKFECRVVASNPQMEASEHMIRHFRCKVACPSKMRTILSDAGREPSFSVYFSQGSAHTVEPTLADVLDCLAGDAWRFEDVCYPSPVLDPMAKKAFENWANEYGYDTDSRKAEKTFKAIKRQSEQMKRTLGTEAYEELLYNTERI